MAQARQGDGGGSRSLANVGLLSIGAVSALLVARYKDDVIKFIKWLINRKKPEFRDRGSDPILDLSSIIIEKARKGEQYPVDMNDLLKKMPAVSQWTCLSNPWIPNSMAKCWPVEAGIGRPGYGVLNNKKSKKYEPLCINSDPNELVTQVESGMLYENDFSSEDLADVIFEAGKYCFSYNSQIAGLSSIKDVLAICDFPTKVFMNVCQAFRNQGVEHLAIVLEQDSEVQSMLRLRADVTRSDKVVLENRMMTEDEEEQMADRSARSSPDVLV